MNLQHRISAFVQLGQIFRSLGDSAPWPGYSCGLNESEYADLNMLVERVHAFNAWFTEPEVRRQLRALGSMLEEEELRSWTDSYVLSDDLVEKRVAIVMAGNVPLVGFHDLLCVLMSGMRAEIKLSSDDDKLLPAFLEAMRKWAPDLIERVTIHHRPFKNFDAVIATGSNNTARYFEHYFANKPRIIRKGRTSVAVLDGSEDKETLEGLGHDVFDYFGLGCRNVTKLYLPKGFDLDRFFDAIYPFNDIINHHKYANNFDYHRAIWLLNQDDLLENGFLLLKEDSSLVSPVGALFYEYYTEEQDVVGRLDAQKEEIQCVVGKNGIPLGQAQHPSVSEYADHVDTMQFLVELQ